MCFEKKRDAEISLFFENVAFSKIAKRIRFFRETQKAAGGRRRIGRGRATNSSVLNMRLFLFLNRRLPLKIAGFSRECAIKSDIIYPAFLTDKLGELLNGLPLRPPLVSSLPSLSIGVRAN